MYTRARSWLDPFFCTSCSRTAQNPIQETWAINPFAGSKALLQDKIGTLCVFHTWNGGLLIFDQQVVKELFSPFRNFAANQVEMSARFDATKLTSIINVIRGLVMTYKMLKTPRFQRGRGKEELQGKSTVSSKVQASRVDSRLHVVSSCCSSWSHSLLSRKRRAEKETVELGSCVAALWKCIASLVNAWLRALACLFAMVGSCT